MPRLIDHETLQRINDTRSYAWQRQFVATDPIVKLRWSRAYLRLCIAPLRYQLWAQETRLRHSARQSQLIGVK